MQKFQQNKSEATPVDFALFVGDVAIQDMVTGQNAQGLVVHLVNFDDGAKTQWHTHSAEQVLIVTSGSGIVATRDEELTIEPGDVVLVAPNEDHWHGAKPGASMSHFAIMPPSEVSISDQQD